MESGDSAEKGEADKKYSDPVFSEAGTKDETKIKQEPA